MNLKHLSDETLDQDTVRLVRSERELLAQILHHLREIDCRRLFATHKCESLFVYATRRLGYSEDQAARRISAMRLLKELPQIEEKIESGALTLSQLNKAQIVFNRERKAQRIRSSEAKLELLSQIEGTSIRETEKTLELGAYVPQAPKEEVPVSLDQFSESLRAKLKRLLDVRSHVNPAGDLEKLIDELADLGLAKWDEFEKAARIAKRNASTSRRIERAAAATNLSEQCRVELLNDAAVPATSRVNFSAAVKRAVFLRHRKRCANCGTSRFIEIDHIVPVALGGSNDIENLRLLCRSCNQRHAIDIYGARKMENYLRSPVTSAPGR